MFGFQGPESVPNSSKGLNSRYRGPIDPRRRSMASTPSLLDGATFLKYAAVKTAHSIGSLGPGEPFDPGRVKTVVAFLVSGIGNTIMYTPTLVNLRENFPDARIICVVGPRASVPVIEGSPYVDDVLVLPIFDRVKGMGGSMQFSRTLRALKPQLTLNNLLSTGPDNAMHAYRSGARWRVGHAYGPEDRHWKSYYVGFESFYTHRVPVVEGRHEVELNLDLLRVLGLKVRKVKPFFWTEEEDREFAREYLEEWGFGNETIIGFHPGTNPDMVFKRWHPDRFARVIRRAVTELGASVLVFGSRDERELAEGILNEAAGGMRRKHKGPGAALNLCGELSLRRSAALIARCRTFVSNDSGLMHVAAAMGVPVVGVFGPTDHRRTSPYGKEHVLVRSGEECSPCYVRSGSMVNCAHHGCLENVSADMVWDAVLRQLRRRRPAQK